MNNQEQMKSQKLRSAQNARMLANTLVNEIVNSEKLAKAQDTTKSARQNPKNHRELLSGTNHRDQNLFGERDRILWGTPWWLTSWPYDML